MRFTSAGRAVRGVEALVGIGVAREVRVGCDLPAGEVDRLEAGLDHLHGLAARHRAERRHPLVLGEQPPQPLRAEAGERVLDRDRAAQTLDVGLAVGTLDGVCRAHGRVLLLDPSFGHLGSYMSRIARCKGHISADFGSKNCDFWMHERTLRPCPPCSRPRPTTSRSHSRTRSVSGALGAPGSVLRQEQLSEQFAVSRTPIREALRRLSALGLVSFEPKRGRPCPHPLAPRAARGLPRPGRAREARHRARGGADEGDDLARLDAAESRFSGAHAPPPAEREERADRGDPALAADWMRANHEFHDVIYDVAGAPYLTSLAQSARRTFVGQLGWSTSDELDELYARNDAQHRAMPRCACCRQRGGRHGSSPASTCSRRGGCSRS